MCDILTLNTYLKIAKNPSKGMVVIISPQLRRLKDLVLHAFFPTRCPFCGTVIPCSACSCEECDRHLTKLSPRFCAICGESVCVCNTRKYSFSQVMALFPYEGLARHAVIAMKFQDHPSYACSFGLLMAEHVNKWNCKYNISLIIPVSMTRKKQSNRGYNQASLFAKAISRETNLPMNEKILIKSKQTKEQHTLSAKRRRTNLENAYTIRNPELVQGKIILLVDDIFTTGATSNECAKMLINAGAKKVMVAVICKVYHNYNKTIEPEIIVEV